MPSLIIERGKKWDRKNLAPKTIALDGAIEGPYIDAENEIFSFDHHGECIRGITLSTCEQVKDFIDLGLDVTGYTILLNDIDMDSALAAWLLMYPSRTSEPLIEKLIHAAGRQDAHAGGYPINKDIQIILDYISEPETKMRADASYQNCSNEVLTFVLEAIWRRIEQYADGKTPSDLEDREGRDSEDYEVIRKGTDWKLVRLRGERSLRGLARDGINKYVGIREVQHEDDSSSLIVTVGKRSEVVTGFPVGPADKEGTILHALNKEEPDRKEKDDNWGGTTTIGGSPRNSNGKGTMLDIDKIFNIVENVVTATRSRKTGKKDKVIVNKDIKEK
jgi:hypothetical protein